MTPSPPRRSGPLAGLRILDLSSVVLGPFATMILADLGADVIKVERPEGDSSRFVNPGRNPGMAGTALVMHRNKRSIAVDLRLPEGRDIVLRVAGTCDALFHNMRPRKLERLGLGYREVRARRPDIVYCVCTGYGPGGPYSGRPAYDDLIQGASGLAQLMGRAYGAPRYVPMALCDKVVAMAVANALLAALLRRERTGEGQHVEVPMFETMVTFNMAEHLCDSVFDPPLEPFGYARVLSADRRPYPTLDGHVCILAYTDRQWRSFFEIVGAGDPLDDPRFRTLSDRTRNTDALYGIVADAVAKRTTAEWLDRCREAEIPAEPVRDPADARSDPHLRAVGFFERRDHPTEGGYFAPGIAARFSETPCRVDFDAPRLGENAEEILREAGFGEGEIRALSSSPALARPPEIEDARPAPVPRARRKG